MTRSYVPGETPRERAEHALRVPDLEWAGPLVHGLAGDVLACEARIEKLREALDTVAFDVWPGVSDPELAMRRTAAAALEGDDG